MSDNDALKGGAGAPRLVLTLGVAGLLSGVIIIAIVEATAETIAANKARELREAVFNVLPGIVRMQKLVYQDERLVATSDTVADELPVYAGYDQQDGFVGYAIPGAGPGFQDTIRLLYGYRPEARRVVGMQVLESRETPGLGDKIYKDARFVANFANLSIEPEISVVKKGRRTGDNEVDAITGATISSKAVVRIINETNAIWLPRFPQPGTEPGPLLEEPVAEVTRG